MNWQPIYFSALSWFKQHWDGTVSLLVSAAAVWYTRRQWTEAKKAREESKESAKAQALDVQKSLEIARRSAEAAEKSAEASVKGILGAQRAHLIPDEILPKTMSNGDETLIFCRVRIRNIGRTAAFNVSMFNDVQKLDLDSEPRQGSKALVENHLLPEAILFAPEAKLSVPQSDAITLLNTVIIEFDDIFQDRWRMQWCYAIFLHESPHKVQLLAPHCSIRKK